MGNPVFTSDTPSALPGSRVQPDDMALVTDSDWQDIRTIARKYCRTVNFTRSRKRMDGNTTIAGGPFGKYGTADISDDVTQDAVLLFAQNLAKISSRFQPASLSVATRTPDSWLYVTGKGREFVADRKMIMGWAVKDAAARNGFRTDDEPDEIDATPGEQYMRGVAHAEFVATGSYLASISDVVWGSAYGDGRDFPVIDRVLAEGSKADDIGRAGVLSHVAQQLYGGQYGSRRAVRRARDAALAELRELTQRLDETREMLAYSATRRDKRRTGALPDD
ncbi:hypothetical protein E0F15_18490 [Frankia sp. B2]|uniref:hypothetical protein n=1 Tax=unclassified Frankia TaxID=2632575 RepID=UPI0006CA15FE|nr:MULTISPECIES: hypothetical protein [unclassified Frankia]KPM52698.1 hypothetical protein ACG83_24760 [Frankia sp. R43]TFE26243.1 hypothetical protein E0F15_18490 [Frankia sp. B2]